MAKIRYLAAMSHDPEAFAAYYNEVWVTPA